MRQRERTRALQPPPSAAAAAAAAAAAHQSPLLTRLEHTRSAHEHPRSRRDSGGPVFNQVTGEVVGVAFSGRTSAEGQGFIIPTPVVRNFLAVYEATGTFGRLPSLGIGTQTLTNTAMRGLLLGGGVSQPPHHDGILVTRVRRFSCAESAGVKPGDILMAIDGTKVSEEGEVTFRGHERVEFEYLITTKKVGESVTLSLLRSAHGASETSATFDINALAEAPEVPKPLEVRVTLAPTHELVPRELYKDCTSAGLPIPRAALGAPPCRHLCSHACYLAYHMPLLLTRRCPPDRHPPHRRHARVRRGGRAGLCHRWVTTER